MASFKTLIRPVVEKILDAHPLLSGRQRVIPASWVWLRTAVSTGHKYIYVRIPKCANTTITNTLFMYDKGAGLNGPTLKAHTIKRQFETLRDTRKKNLESLKNEYFIFTFLRNPYSRVLSAFLDKIHFRQHYAKSEYSKFMQHLGKKQQDISFDDFIGFLENGGLYKNPHWTPQISLLPFPPGDFDFIGKTERLSQDMNQVISRVYPDKTWEGLYQPEGRRRTNSSGLVSQYYNDSLVEKVYSLYKEDFDAFGFSRDLPAK
jgi:dermatan 4-sulfotransferase 1